MRYRRDPAVDEQLRRLVAAEAECCSPDAIAWSVQHDDEVSTVVVDFAGGVDTAMFDTVVSVLTGN